LPVAGDERGDALRVAYGRGFADRQRRSRGEQRRQLVRPVAIHGLENLRRHQAATESPPSTYRTWPVTYAASSDARNTSAAATSPSAMSALPPSTSAISVATWSR